MNKKILIFALTFLLPVGLFAQTVKWDAFIDSVNNFSSARVTDLNGDGVMDVISGGGLEDNARTQTVAAFDGVDGTVLWTAYSRDQIYGTAALLDITNDGVEDVFIGGRDAVFMALDGKSGRLIWEYFPGGELVDPSEEELYNFYNAQFIPDQDGDGIKDILVGNGGDKFAGPLDFDRPAGHLMVINSATGAKIAKAKVPDEQEIYMSAYVHDFMGDGNLEVIYGTGGETTPGSLWRVSLADVLAENLSNSVKLVDGDDKGVVAPPVLADLNTDGVMDIVTHMYTGQIVALNGVNNKVLWSHDIEMGETVASPIVGHFNEDAVLDVFSLYGIGLSPTFREFKLMLIDGATGEIQSNESTTAYCLVTPLAYDHDSDGIDEVLMVTHKPFSEGPPFQHKIRLLDFNDDTQTDLVPATGGTILGSTPWVGDMDGDNTMELVYSYMGDDSNPKPDAGYFMRRIDLGVAKPDKIAYGAYMGTDGDGKYNMATYECASFQPQFMYDGRMCEGFGMVGATITDGSAPYVVEWNGVVFSPRSDLSYVFDGLDTGNYRLKITDNAGCTASIDVGVQAWAAPLEVSLRAENEEAAVNGQARVQATAAGGLGDLTYSWAADADEESGELSGLGYGTYVVTVMDENGCSVTRSISLDEPIGLEEDLLGLTMQLYPNPNKGLFELTIPTDAGTILKVYHTNGQLVQSVLVATGAKKQAMNLSSLTAGVYYAVLERVDGEAYVERFVVFE